MRKIVLLTTLAILVGALTPALAKNIIKTRMDDQTAYNKIVHRIEALPQTVISRKSYQSLVKVFYPADFYYLQALSAFRNGQPENAALYLDSAQTTYTQEQYCMAEMLCDYRLKVSLKLKDDQKAQALEMFLTNYPHLVRSEIYDTLYAVYTRAQNKPKMVEYTFKLRECRSFYSAFDERMKLVELLMSVGLNADALKELNQCAVMEPEDPSVYRLRANVHHIMGDSINAVNDVITFGQKNTKINLGEFKHIIMHSPYLFASTTIERSHGKNYKQLFYLKWMAAVVYQWAGLTKEEVAIAEDTYAQSNFHSRALAVAYYNQGLYEEAIKFGEFYESQYSFNDPDYHCFGVLGAAAAALGRYDKAWEYYNRGSQLKPDESYYQRSKGDVCFFKNDLINAIRYYDMALELDPRDSVALVSRGWAYRKMGMTDRANEDFKSMLEITHPDESHLLVQCYIGNKERAIQICDSLLDAKPIDWNINYSAARLYSILNDKHKALIYLRNALEMGFYDITYMKFDLDLENIKKTPEFKALAKEFQTKKRYTPKAVLPQDYTKAKKGKTHKSR